MGKTAILMVFSIVVTFAIVLPNIHRMSRDAVTTYYDYSIATRRHNIAISGANMAAQRFFLDPTWRAGYTNTSFNGGTFNVTMEDVSPTRIKLTSIGSYSGTKDTVSILFQTTYFSFYAYYSAIEGNIFWITGDTVNGPFHTQDSIQVNGSPVFNGKATTRLGNAQKNTNAIFNSGYQTGVSISLPTDLSAVQSSASANGRVVSSGDVWITMKGDSVLWKTSANGAVTRTTIAQYAPNGAVVIANGNLHVQGTLHGEMTLCARQGNNSNGGNIYIEDNVIYSQDPRTYPNSTDMLGLVADNDVIIAANSANYNNCVLQASVFSLNGGLMSEVKQNFSITDWPISGTLDILGGLTQFQRGVVGTFNNGVINHGFQKRYAYDNRFLNDAPPSFPLTSTFQIISWYE